MKCLSSLPSLTTLAIFCSLFTLFSLAPPALAQSEIEEIVVTAQKREQGLQETPIAITTLSTSEIEALGIVDVEDISSLVPNVIIAQTPSNGSAVTLSFRGGVTINPALTWEPTVGIYLDGVYIGKNQGGLFEIADLERIEVLRGPQGSLYGRNTLGGAVNLITKKPSGSGEGSVKLGLGNYNQNLLRFTYDLPLEGPLTAKIALMSSKRDGYIEVEPHDGRSTSTALPGVPQVDQLEDWDSLSGQLSLRWKISEAITMDYSYDFSEIDNSPRFAQLTDTIPNWGATLQVPIWPIEDYRETEYQDTAYIDRDVLERSEVDGHGLTFSYDLGGDTELKHIIAVRELAWDDQLDLDGSPFPVAATARYSDYESFSQELQLVGSSGNLDYVLGLFQFSDDGYTENPQQYFAGGSSVDSQYGFETRATALYGQIDWHLNERLTLTAGLRSTTEEKDGERSLVILADGTGQLPPALLPFTAISSTQGAASADFDAVTPTLVASYKVGDGLNLYAKYSEGFKSGGFNAEHNTVAEVTTPYDAETVTSLELGFKWTSASNRLQLNAALFNNTHEDMQLSFFLGTNSAASIVRNAGEATISGLELELLALIGEQLRLTLGYGSLDASYDEFMEGGEDVSGDRAFPYAPESNLNLGLEYRFGVSSSFRLHYSQTDDHHVYAFDPDPTAAFTSANTAVKAYSLLDLFLRFEGIAGDNLNLDFWIKNALDEEYTSNGIPFGPNFGNLTVNFFGPPMTAGANLEYLF